MRTHEAGCYLLCRFWHRTNVCPESECHRADRERKIMPNTPKKCANAACTCPAPEKAKYCSAHCEGIANRTEINCLCRHEDCGGKPA